MIIIHPKQKSNNVDNIIIGKSTRIVCLSAIIGKTITVTPKTKAMFAILDPTMFPIAIPGLPPTALCKLTKSSGADVPNATTVIPITNGDIFIAREKPTAPLTKNSPPIINTAKPANNIKMPIEMKHV